jgi:hypothetical protein
MEHEGSNDISRIRTFTADAARLQQNEVPVRTSVNPPAADTAEAPETETEPETGGTHENPPFHFIRSHVEEVEIPAQKPATRLTPSVPAPAVPRAPQLQQANAPVTLTVPDLPSSKESILSDHIRVFDMGDEGVETGTIVKETKRNRQNLAAGIVGQVRGWFTHKQSVRHARKAATPKVAAAEKRIETISAAAAPGVLPEQDDHDKIRKEVQQKPTVTATSSLAITEKRAVPAPHWTYTVTEGESTDTIADKEALAPPRAVRVTNVEKEVFANITETVSEPSLPTPPAPAPIPTPTIPTEPVTIPSPTLSPAAPPEPIPTPPTVEKPEAFESAPEPIRTQPRRGTYLLVAASVVAAFLGVGAGILLIGVFNQQQPSSSVEVLVDAPLRADQNVAIPLTPNGGVFRQNLATAATEHGRGFIYYYPTMATQAGTIVPAPLPDLLTVMNWRAPGSFVRAIETVAFGTADGMPFMMLKVTSFETALSGMLQWERALIEDLTPWLGTAPVSSFSDVTQGNQDLRIARRSDGSEVLYLFLDRTTLLITTNRSVPALVRERLP